MSIRQEKSLHTIGVGIMNKQINTPFHFFSSLQPARRGFKLRIERPHLGQYAALGPRGQTADIVCDGAEHKFHVSGGGCRVRSGRRSSALLGTIESQLESMQRVVDRRAGLTSKSQLDALSKERG